MFVIKFTLSIRKDELIIKEVKEYLRTQQGQQGRK